MKEGKMIRNSKGKIKQIQTSLKGKNLLSIPLLNKGTAFTKNERLELHLLGLLPSQLETLEEQVLRAYQQYQNKTDPFEKYLYLSQLQNINETLFYKLIIDHIEEMLPIIYTPTIGEAVQKFSANTEEYRGLFIAYSDKNRIDDILKNRINSKIDLIVVTDSEAILGIGDQGTGGINIAIGKLAVYTLCAKINPHRVLPIQLDVGTNNETLLQDPRYLGWRHKRITGKKYDDFIKTFVAAISKQFPRAFLHWEDFGRDNAQKNLDRFKNTICSFNDDIQGTGVVTLAALLSALDAYKKILSGQNIVIFGAGAAGMGIADKVQEAMIREGLSKKEACDRIYLLNSRGLITEEMEKVNDSQKNYAKPHSCYSHWKTTLKNKISLLDVVKQVKPSILIGCSTVPHSFNEKIIKTMAKHTEHPIIFPLSNPTSKSEATPKELLEWTHGKALIATGSPFLPVKINKKIISVSQCNNAFVFPGIGLGVIASKAKKLTDNMLWAACKALVRFSPTKQNKTAPLLPRLTNIHKVSYAIAIEVAKQAIKDKVAKKIDHIEHALSEASWEPKYYSYKKLK